MTQNSADSRGRVRVSARNIPSGELGGDSYDHRWIDADHILVYVIDVCGHGPEPAMVALSVRDLIRSGMLAAAILREPSRVLAELNGRFQMDRLGGKYFTIWYGVYQPSTRTLRFASSGHPPALVFTRGSGGLSVTRLSTEAIPVGVFEDTEYHEATFVVPADSEILVFSDGAFDLGLPGARWWSLSEFVDLCAQVVGDGDWSLDELVGRLQTLTVSGIFEDDCTLVRLGLA